MVDINPLALINNPRFTPKIQDHSAIQKLLTDAHIQQSKNKAAAARNLQTVRGSAGNAMLSANVDPSSVYKPLGINVPNIGNIMRTRDALKRGLTSADTLSKLGSTAKSLQTAGYKPQIASGSVRNIVSGPQIATSESPVQRQVVSKQEVKKKSKQFGGETLGATDVTETTGQTFKGSQPVGQTKHLPSIIADTTRWSEISRPIKRTADHLKISVQELIAKVKAGLKDGSVQLSGTKDIIIDGQPFTWLN